MSENSSPVLVTCFDDLPIESIMKIIESLCGVDLARISCVNHLFQLLSSNNELWYKKFTEEFGDSIGIMQPLIDWRKAYASEWRHNRTLERVIRQLGELRRAAQPVRGCPSHLMPPGPYCSCNWCFWVPSPSGPLASYAIQVQPGDHFICPHCRSSVPHNHA